MTKLKAEVPKLKEELNYLKWQKSIEIVCEIYHVSHMIKYRMKPPVTLELGELKPADLQKLEVPEELQAQIRARVKQDTYELFDPLIKIFNIKSEDTDDELLEFTVKSVVTVHEKCLYTFYVESGDFIKNRSAVSTDRATVQAMQSKALDKKFHHFLKEKDILEVLTNMELDMGRSDSHSKIELKSKLLDLVFADMTTFVNECQNVLAEYVTVGGDRGDEDLKEGFMRKLPREVYGVHKILIKQSGRDKTLSEIISYFMEVEELDNLRNPARKDPIKVDMELSRVTGYPKQFKRVEEYASSRVLRGRTCCGCGHAVQDCPTQKVCCGICGSYSHYHRNCPTASSRMDL